MDIKQLKQRLHEIFDVNPQVQIGGENNSQVIDENDQTPTQEKDYTAKDGVVYKVSLDNNNQNIIVKDINGNQKDSFSIAQKDQDGVIKKEDRNSIVALFPEVATPQPQSTITQPEQISTPVEAPIAENEAILKKFIDEYGEEKGKQVYYATANSQNRSPETFKK
jgi:hypothetical protein